MSDDMTKEQFYGDILRQMIECNSTCDISVPREKRKEGLEKVDRYMRVLPGAEYVLTQTLNYIFSNGITTGSIVQDDKLDDFLYAENDRSTTNLHEIRNAIGMAISHGSSGMRWLDGNVYQYKWGTYRALSYVDNGISKIIGYVVSKKGDFVPSVKLNYDKYKEYADIAKDIDDRGLILLSRDDFTIIRNDTSEVYGRSPLLADESRLDLLAATYDRLNYDIRYDGPGRIIIRPKVGLGGTDNEISTSEVMSVALEHNQKQVEEIKKEVARVATELKSSSSDSAIALSNAFDKDITHLPRVTKATEFFNWLKNDTMIIAQDFGMSPSLLELGGVSGNVSMEKIIDNSMINSIVPLRERYAVQVNNFIAPKLEVDKIYFDLYSMQQQEDENTMRTKVVNMMSLLNSMKDNDGNTREKAIALFNDLAEMLSKNIHNEVDQLEKL